MMRSDSKQRRRSRLGGTAPVHSPLPEFAGTVREGQPLGPPPGLLAGTPSREHDRSRRSRGTPRRNGHRRQELEPQHTEEYWGEDVVARAVESGELFAAPIRFNPHDTTQAFVTVKGLPADVCVQGKLYQNRTIEGPGDLSQERQSPVKHIASRMEATGKRPQGKVVALLTPSKRRDRIVGFLKCPSPGHQLLLTPCNPRLPTMLLPSSDVHQVPGQAPFNTMCVASMREWRAGAEYPEGELVDVIGEAGDLQTDRMAVLSMEGIDTSDFSDEVVACLPQGVWQIPADEVQSRTDFRNLRIFSIDPATAKDLDDALSIEPLSDSRPGYRVGVHIADVTHFIQQGSALDHEAWARGTSVYLAETVIPMLPHKLCEELCSLNPGVDRLAFSIVWEMDEEGRVLSKWAGRSIIRSCAKLSYAHAQAVIDGMESAEDHKPSADDEDALIEALMSNLVNGGSGIPEAAEKPCLPPVEAPHFPQQVEKDIQRLHSLAAHMRKRRIANGALRLDNMKFSFRVNAAGEPQAAMPEVRKEANFLVEEFMLLANITAAEIISAAFPYCALRRRHPPPQPKSKLQLLERTVQELGAILDTSSAASMATSLAVIQATQDDVMTATLTLMATKPMQPAVYFCIGDQDVPSDEMGHYALAVPMYTHFTSPIRRYADVIVHRLMQAALQKATVAVPHNGSACIAAAGAADSDSDEEGIAEARLAGCPYTTKACMTIAAACTAAKASADSAQDASQHLHLGRLLRDKPIITQGVVLNLRGSKFFDIFVPEIGFETRVTIPGDLYPRPIDVKWDRTNSTLLLSSFTGSRRPSLQPSPVSGKDWDEQPSSPQNGTDWDAESESAVETSRMPAGTESETEPNSQPNPDFRSAEKPSSSQQVAINAFTPGHSAPDTQNVVAATRVAVLKALGGPPKQRPSSQTDALGWPIMGA
ncbi:hypothetical protein WJX73_009531 [Symbiochloris irregularis]|uniref:RNB domain-containing protein n=1 Tax=Symbiochloris irregularis TaxID=706552 RepID=A0AAW1PBJ4_9CHLO